MSDFMKLEKYGQIKIDKILFASNYPILFTCFDEKKNLYICVCCQNNSLGKKWLLTKTSPLTIIKMLKDEISIREAFLTRPDCRVSILSNQDGTYEQYDVESDWSEDSKFLPKAGEYMESEEGEFDEEIAYFETLCPIDYNGEFVRNFQNFTNETNDFMLELDTSVLLNNFAFPFEIPSFLKEIYLQEKINTSFQITLKSFEEEKESFKSRIETYLNLMTQNSMRDLESYDKAKYLTEDSRQIAFAA